MELHQERPSIFSFFSLCSRSFESSISVLKDAKNEFHKQLSISELEDERGRFRILGGEFRRS